jgi:ribosomal protein L32
MTIDDNPYKHDSDCTEACPACRWRMAEMKKELDSPKPSSPCPDCGEWRCSHHVSEYWFSLTAERPLDAQFKVAKNIRPEG